MTIKPNHRILVVEDSEDDYAATVRAFKKAGLANPIDRCINGDDALDYIYNRGKYANTDYNAPSGHYFAGFEYAWDRWAGSIENDKKR